MHIHHLSILTQFMAGATYVCAIVIIKSKRPHWPGNCRAAIREKRVRARGDSHALGVFVFLWQSGSFMRCSGLVGRPACLPLSVFPIRACMIKHRAIAEKWTGHKHTDTPLFGLCHIIYLMVRAQQK
jgi:hypothetical protein